MPFPHPFAVVGTRDGRNFWLMRPLVYVTNAGETITIPEGTTTDGASTPRALWDVLPPTGDYFLAAVVHDYLYRNTARPRAECDAILHEALVSLQVSDWEREAIYNGVRLGGSWAFAEDRGR